MSLTPPDHEVPWEPRPELLETQSPVPRVCHRSSPCPALSPRCLPLPGCAVPPRCCPCALPHLHAAALCAGGTPFPCGFGLGFGVNLLFCPVSCHRYDPWTLHLPALPGASVPPCPLVLPSCSGRFGHPAPPAWLRAAGAHGSNGSSCPQIRPLCLSGMSPQRPTP